jgi:hypothetical protein
MKLINNSIHNNELKKMALKMHGDMVKAVVDIEKKLWLLMLNYIQMKKNIY